MPLFTNGVKQGASGSGASSADILKVDSGLSFTGGFTDRTTGAAGSSDVGSNRSYSAADATANRWMILGLDATQQAANDSIYWGSPDTASMDGYDATKGLFGGTQLPQGVTQLFDFSSTALSTDGSLSNGDLYLGAGGSLDFSTCQIGDLLECRFDFNIVPQIANSTLEVALLWVTRDSNDAATFSFSLTHSPLFFGTGTVGKTKLIRPVMTAYFASDEDINAVALPAIRCDNAIQIQPLTLLAAIQR
jgi:hypothetical protein